MKTLLVTGAAGFIGSRFAESALARGDSVIAVDEKRHFGERPQLSRIRFGQIVDRAELEGWLAREKPKLSAVVHLGARTDTAEKDPAVFQALNVDYSKMLWNYATREKLPFVYASSAATYGGGELGYSDDEALLSKLK
ncbi:MAG: NAD-dependent epimerase/dehydratase family protein, partial [Bdellovibrionota bacterium]